MISKEKIKNIFETFLNNTKAFFTGKYFVSIKNKHAERKKELDDVLNLEEMDGKYTKDEISSISRKLHKIDNEEYDITQNGLCFFVVGLIFLGIGILFIFLSLLKRVNVIIGINFLSLQFFICVISLLIAIACLTYGLTKFILAYNVRKKILRKINVLGNLKTR